MLSLKISFLLVYYKGGQWSEKNSDVLTYNENVVFEACLIRVADVYVVLPKELVNDELAWLFGLCEVNKGPHFLCFKDFTDLFGIDLEFLTEVDLVIQSGILEPPVLFI